MALTPQRRIVRTISLNVAAPARATTLLVITSLTVYWKPCTTTSRVVGRLLARSQKESRPYKLRPPTSSRPVTSSGSMRMKTSRGEGTQEGGQSATR